VATWAELAAAQSGLARAGERLFRGFTLAFLAKRDRLFELDVERAQHKTRRDGKAVYTRWPA
jgi:hypothetical protein